MSSRIDRNRTVVVVVDMQERLLAAMPEARRSAITKSACTLVEGARLLGLSIVATEQYSKGLGPTVDPLRDALVSAGVTPIEKLDFSALDEVAVRTELERIDAKRAIVVGMETHVCVFQTVRDLIGNGLKVHVLEDAVASRTEDNRKIGLRLCEREGAVRSSVEAVLFDALRRAEGDLFKAISKLVR